MGYHFTQEISARRTGFGNTVMATLGTPQPIAEELWPGSELVSFDKHPYIAKDGWGNLDGSDYPEQPVESCTGVLIGHRNGSTEELMVADYTPKGHFWGLEGADQMEGITLANGVEVGSDLLEITIEVDYDSTLYLAYDLSRVAFQSVMLSKDGELREFKNVACLPKDSWRQATTTYRMWSDTESWGSAKEKYLAIPSLKRRD